MNHFVARFTSLRGARAQRVRKLLVLALVALLICWPLPDGAQAAGSDLDPTFGSGGKVITAFSGFEDEGAAVVIQPDGKIIAAGTTFPSFSESAFALAL